MADSPASAPDPIETEPSTVVDVFGGEAAADTARAYVEFLGDAGIVRGLIGPRERSRLWTRHVLNSAVVAPLLPADSTVVDIGSGAGLPGIPLAIARPDCRLVLVEPLERRCVFLTEAVEVLGLTNVTVVRGRAEQVVDTAGGADVVTSRAVAPLGRLVGWSAPLLRVGGRILALKGSSAAEEIDRDRADLDRLHLTDVQVHEVGHGVVDPVTFVVDATLSRALPVAKARKPSRRSR